MAKIIVRSYKRPDLVKEKTLKFLQAQEDLDLGRDLFIVVHEEELELYKESLKDIPKAGFITKSEKGGHKSIEAACSFFPKGEELFFLDDDLAGFTHFVGSVEKANLRPLTNLGFYIEDAFKTLRAIGASSWTLSLMSNPFWIKDKAWKEFRPQLLVGGYWGAINCEECVTPIAHDDDRLRTASFIEKDGGSLVYNWVSYESKEVELFPGGMQASGDRGSPEELVEKTRLACDRLWREEPLYRKYHKGYFLCKWRGIYSAQMKSITSIKKLRTLQNWTWKSYMQVDPDAPVEIHEDESVLTLFA